MTIRQTKKPLPLEDSGEAGAPIASESSKGQVFRRVLLLAGFVIMLTFSAYFLYLYVQEQCRPPLESQGVKIALNSPGFLSVGDTDEINVTVVNERGDTATITVTVEYAGNSLCLAGDDESHAAVFDSLPSRARATRKLQMGVIALFYLFNGIIPSVP